MEQGRRSASTEPCSSPLSRPNVQTSTRGAEKGVFLSHHRTRPADRPNFKTVSGNLTARVPLSGKVNHKQTLTYCAFGIKLFSVILSILFYILSITSLFLQRTAFSRQTGTVTNSEIVHPVKMSSASDFTWQSWLW